MWFTRDRGPNRGDLKTRGHEMFEAYFLIIAVFAALPGIATTLLAGGALYVLFRDR